MVRETSLAFLLLGCSAADAEPAVIPGPSFCPDAEASALSEGPAANDGSPLSEAVIDGSACGAVERAYALESSPHVPSCSSVVYSTDPPTSGAHYDHWAAFDSYDEPVPRGFYVHSMEHGAVVILYSCSDCGDELAAAQAMIDALPVDPACSGGVLRRVILTPDPLLEARWAAAAWGFTLEADCFEAEVFRDFALTHYASGPEDFCSGGVRPEQG